MYVLEESRRLLKACSSSGSDAASVLVPATAVVVRVSASASVTREIFFLASVSPQEKIIAFFNKTFQPCPIPTFQIEGAVQYMTKAGSSRHLVVMCYFDGRYSLKGTVPVHKIRVKISEKVKKIMTGVLFCSKF